MIKIVSSIVLAFSSASIIGQSAWPGSNWDSATNLTSIMSASGVEGLSGAHYNSTKKQLFLVQDAGRLRVIQFNEQSGNHLQLTDRNLGGDLEGVTQTNDGANEFWVINEDEYIIQRYQYSSNFSTFMLLKSWNLLLPQGGMTQSLLSGPEDICFVPDSYLQTSGFVSSVSGASYTSQKGMGGLIFIAHQDLGQIWVYDVNQNVNDDLYLVGVYNSNRQESCGLSFDRSTGLLYVLHNIDNNYLEVCSLSSTLIGQNYKLDKVQEFNVTIPTNGGKNIEGVALRPKCEDTQNPTLWLVRDLEGTISTNALRQFRPFGLVGTCDVSVEEESLKMPDVHPNPASDFVSLDYTFEGEIWVEILNSHGELVSKQLCSESNKSLDISQLSSGLYFLKVESSRVKLLIH